MIKIIDLYSGNDEVHFSFDKFVLDGYTGVIFKGGQGEYPDVPRVKPEWWKQAKAAGLHRGYYWLKDSRHRASLEFEALKTATNLDFGELGMWIDCEKPMTSMSDAQYWKTSYPGYNPIYDLMYRVQQTKASQFNENMPGVYTSPGFWKLLSVPTASAKWFAKAPLWTAQYPWIYREGVSKPTIYGAWTKPLWWQYREGPDVNLWMGTDEEYRLSLPIVGQPDTPADPEEARFTKWREFYPNGTVHDAWLASARTQR